MTTILRLLALLALATGVFAAEPVFVTVENRSYPASAITGAAVVTVTAPLVVGGTGETTDPAWSGKVVLLDRGTITFAAKVKAVVNAGGVAAVIANNVAGPANAGTLAPETATIPALTVSQADGATLKTKVGATARVGTAVPPIVIPDPAGNAGKYLMSDGTKYVLVSLPAVPVARVKLNATAEGLAPFIWTWKKDGAVIEGQTTATLVFPSPAPAGNYTAVATNDFGSAEATVEIKAQ